MHVIPWFQRTARCCCLCECSTICLCDEWRGCAVKIVRLRSKATHANLSPWLSTGPIGAGLAGGAATNATKQLLKNLTGKQCGYNATSFVADTAVGGFTGLIPGARILGVTGGRGNWNSIFKQMSTKLSNGTISNVSLQTALKMAGGRAVDTALVPGMGAGAVAGTYLEPYIPGYGDACTCPAPQ